VLAAAGHSSEFAGCDRPAQGIIAGSTVGSSQRKLVPIDLQILLGMPTIIIRMSDHAWTNVQSPRPDARVDATGDSFRGQGKHFSARMYVEELDQWLDRWVWQGNAPRGKGKAEETSWEIYSPIENGNWLLTVIARRRDGEHRIASVFIIFPDRLQERVLRGYLMRRK